MDSTNSILRRQIDRDRLDTILRHPDLCARNAWELFIVFFWERLRSECYQALYEDEDPELVPDYKEFTIEGLEIEKDAFTIMLEASASDYIEAMNGRMAIRIGDRPFRVPADEGVTEEALARDVFGFPDTGDGKVRVLKSRVYEPDAAESAAPASRKREDRAYFHKLTYIIECTDDGWDAVSDMEAAAYMWSYTMYRHEGEYVREIPLETNEAFVKIEKVVGMENAYCITDCWESGFRSAVVSVDTQFSAEKIRNWNRENGQESPVDGVDTEDADEYWYNKCDTFRI